MFMKLQSILRFSGRLANVIKGSTAPAARTFSEHFFLYCRATVYLYSDIKIVLVHYLLYPESVSENRLDGARQLITYSRLLK